MTHLQQILASAVFKPALQRFVEEHPFIVATFNFEGDKLRVNLFDADNNDTIDRLLGQEPFTSESFTPEQQFDVLFEFLKITGDLKR